MILLKLKLWRLSKGTRFWIGKFSTFLLPANCDVNEARNRECLQGILFCFRGFLTLKTKSHGCMSSLQAEGHPLSFPKQTQNDLERIQRKRNGKFYLLLSHKCTQKNNDEKYSNETFIKFFKMLSQNKPTAGEMKLRTGPFLLQSIPLIRFPSLILSFRSYLVYTHRHFVPRTIYIRNIALDRRFRYRTA